ncbi:transposable element Tc1 transposase [Trichonephila clavipes]|nr:transposable element Tc1 transposase [Trichonephila clavipes]
MDDNARPHRAYLFEDFLAVVGICWMESQAKSPDLNPVEHFWVSLGRDINRGQYPPNTCQRLKSALMKEWGLLPHDEINNLICSIRVHCEATRDDHIPY